MVHATAILTSGVRSAEVDTRPTLINIDLIQYRTDRGAYMTDPHATRRWRWHDWSPSRTDGDRGTTSLPAAEMVVA
jgi:hypothetical protein